jgi:V/A-type H+-transporting ATPase subunit C
MPQPSYEFALGRISALSTHLLSASQIRRIAEAGTTKEAFKLLLETGYGENAATEQELAQGEIDLIIRSQLQLTRKRIKELTPDPELTGLFLLPVDTHNIKSLLKARLLGISADEILRDGGNFPLETLKDMVQTKYYEDLPPVYRDTLNKVENELGREADPLSFSAMIDGAMFSQARQVMDAKHEHGFIRDFFSLWADYQNTISLIRAQNLHWELNQLRLVLLDAGTIAKSVFEECLDTPPEQLGARLNQGPHGAELVQVINEYAQTNDIGVLAKRMQEGKMLIIRRAKWDTHSLGPIVGYLFAREAEAEALRLIFGALQGGFEPQLPEMYA